MTIDYSKYEGHTEGPWKLGHALHAYEISRRRIVASEESPECGTGIGEVYGVEDLNNRANANLIADAPMLLERCKRLEAAIEQIQVSMLDVLQVGNLQAFEDSIRAAVLVLKEQGQ